MSTSNFNIRPANIIDMPKVASIVSSSADWYEKFVHPDDMDQHDVGIVWALKNYFHRNFFVGETEDEVIGTISMQEVEDYAYLGYIYLDTEHVGNGYGKKLMNFAKKQAKQKGLKGMVLIAHPEAKWAVKAYEKFGFKCIAETDTDVLKWNDGALEPYHEKGFRLFKYTF